jgi:hypothetical protein
MFTGPGPLITLARAGKVCSMTSKSNFPLALVLLAVLVPGTSSAEAGQMPHPSGGFGNDEGDSGNSFTHWDQSEGLCGAEGGCGETLWSRATA